MRGFVVTSGPPGKQNNGLPSSETLSRVRPRLGRAKTKTNSRHDWRRSRSSALMGLAVVWRGCGRRRGSLATGLGVQQGRAFRPCPRARSEVRPKPCPRAVPELAQRRQALGHAAELAGPVAAPPSPLLPSKLPAKPPERLAFSPRDRPPTYHSKSAGGKPPADLEH